MASKIYGTQTLSFDTENSDMNIFGLTANTSETFDINHIAN